jgi:YegS/Rv2252/BmrU family lipid kinase
MLWDQGLTFEVFDTTGPGDAARLALEAAGSGIQTVVACGGDGTVSEVAGALAHTETALAILPMGTGNDFARHLGIHTFPEAVGAIASGKPRSVDMVRWSSGDAGGLFLNVAGTGFDAHVAMRVNQGFRFLRGTGAYIAAVLSSFSTFKPSAVKLLVDGQEVEAVSMLCSVANASCYGGGMRINPQACIDDGLVECVLVKAVSRWEFLKTFPKVFKGTHVDHPSVTVLRGMEIQIDADDPWPFFCDGEICGRLPVRFQVEPKALRVIA